MLINSIDNRIANNIAVVVILLITIGTVLVFSASANLSYELNLQKFYNFAGIRQILFFPLACLTIYVASFFNYRRLSFAKGWLKSPTIYLLVLSIALLILVLLPQFGTEINRARRWLRIPAGPIIISFQPSELAKWSIILFLSAAVSKFGSDIKLYWKRFIPLCCVIGVIVGLIIVEDFGTAVFIALISFIMLVIAGVKLWHILTLLPFGVICFCIVLIRSPNRLLRIVAFLYPEKWADSVAYQANQSLIALGSGGLWGKGLGKGICKYGHLPEDTSDFIFAIMGEELGFVGTAAIIGLFIAFICSGIMVIKRCQDPFGRILAGGIVVTIALQAAINIGVVTVMLPTKGIPLPFISAGGTSLLLSSAAVGILINIAKKSTNKTTELKEEPDS